MSGLVSLMRRASGTGTYLPPGGASYGPAINSGTSNPYFSTLIYLNMVKNLYSDWSAGTRDPATECLATLTSGTTANRSIIAITGADALSCIKQGSYTIRWTGPGTNVAVDVVDVISGGTISGKSRAGLNEYTFTYTNVASDSNVRVYFTNNTGSSAFAITISVVFTAYKTLYDGGEIFSPDWLSCMPDNIYAFRMTGPLQIWGSDASLAAHIRPEAADCWGYAGPGVDGSAVFRIGMPYAVGAKLAIRLSTNIICPFPILGDQACYNKCATELVAGGLLAHPTRKVILTVGNENWDTGVNGNYLNIWGATQSPAISGPAAEAKKLLMCHKAMLAAGFPRDQIILTPELQLYGSWNHVFDGYGALMMQYVDTSGLVSVGATFSDLIDRVHTAPYIHLNDGSAYASPLRNRNLINLDWPNLTNAQIRALFYTDILEIVAVLDARIAELAATTGRVIPLGCYESGSEITYNNQNLSGVYYNFHVNTSLNTGVWETDSVANYSDGDLWIHENTFLTPAGDGSNWTGAGPGTCASALPHQSTAYIKRVDANNCRWYVLHADAVATYATDALAKAAAISLDQPGVSQRFTANNVTRVAQFVTRYTAYHDGPGMAQSLADLHNAVIGPTRLNYPTHYHDVGGYPFGVLLHWWGLKRGPLAADTDQFTYYKALPAT